VFVTSPGGFWVWGFLAPRVWAFRNEVVVVSSCEHCAASGVLEGVAVVHRRTGEESVLSLCAACVTGADRVWRRSWSVVGGLGVDVSSLVPAEEKQRRGRHGSRRRLGVGSNRDRDRGRVNHRGGRK